MKVNANLGTSPEKADIKTELKKLEMAKNAGADAVMDMSTGGDLDSIRREIIAHAGATPGDCAYIPQAAVETVKKRQTITKMKPDELFEVIERQGQDGVDFITVHCGVTQRSPGG